MHFFDPGEAKYLAVSKKIITFVVDESSPPLIDYSDYRKKKPPKNTSPSAHASARDI
jgi:hypothetical protein